VTAGRNATIQARFLSEFDTGVNETYYACADITYVPASEFTFRIPCFNASSPEPEPSSSSAAAPSSSAATAPLADGNGGGGNGASPGGSGLSGGAIAGIVIGAVVGVAVIAIFLIFKYRKDQRGKRVANHQTSPANVKWDEDARSGAGSNNSIQLQTLSK
jgi:hypothetical protein